MVFEIQNQLTRDFLTLSLGIIVKLLFIAVGQTGFTKLRVGFLHSRRVSKLCNKCGSIVTTQEKLGSFRGLVIDKKTPCQLMNGCEKVKTKLCQAFGEEPLQFINVFAGTECCCSNDE